jgi:hypothetical protein
MTEEPKFMVNILFGAVRLESRIRPTADGRLIGEGRKFTYDLDGKLTAQTEWTPTGVVAYFPQETGGKRRMTAMFWIAALSALLLGIVLYG